jgi:acetyl-CoA acetyltransferase
MASRNPLKDQVAIVGVGTTEYARNAGGRSSAALALEASREALRDAGLAAKDVDGVCGTSLGAGFMPSVPATLLQRGLGIPELTWHANVTIPTSFLLIEAMNAVFSGACTTALICHASYRGASNSRSAAADPFRTMAARLAGSRPAGVDPGTLMRGPFGYATWSSRYLHEYGAKKEYFGLVAVNQRTNAGLNPHAVLRDPFTLEDYLNARMVWEPLCLLDMDMPIDGADAFVVTTAERARDLRKKPVYIHAATAGQTRNHTEELTTSLTDHGQTVVARALWEKSDLRREDFDILFPYDGFSIITLLWLESLGFCGRGEAGPFLESHWDVGERRVKIDGKVPLNTHGGSLSEGATQGSGHIREAVMQLRGEANRRQVPGARSALVVPGGIFFNASGLVFRAE